MALLIAPEGLGGAHPRRRRLLAGVVAAGGVGFAHVASACPALLEHRFPDLLTGRSVSLCGYAGRVLMVVNTASQCGYTRQYEPLESLHRRFLSRGLAVLGFPSNDFGQQEPGGSREIAEFCKANFGVSFQMFERMPVSGRGANPFHAQLAQRTGQPPRWNFHKYLIDRRTETVRTYDSQVRPDDPRIVREIERMLAERGPAA